MLWKCTSKHTTSFSVASSRSLHFCWVPHPQQVQAPSCPPKMLPGTRGVPGTVLCLQAASGPLSRENMDPSLLVHHAFNSNFSEDDAVLKNEIKCFCEIGIFFSLIQQIKEFKPNSATLFFPPSGIHNEFSSINYSTIKPYNCFSLVFPNIKNTVNTNSMWLLHRGKKKSEKDDLALFSFLSGGCTKETISAFKFRRYRISWSSIQK